MKIRVVLLLTALLVSTCFLLAQDVPVGVIVAFKKGNAQELHRYLGDKVELMIQNRSSNADRETAGGAISSFFDANRVNDFSVNHQGQRDESSFIIGTLATANGNFRVNCFFRRIQNKYVINQIRIEKKDE